MSSAALFRLPEGSSLSLRDQICQVVGEALTCNAIAPGQPLPSCRAMAAHLGVSRNTVFAAYAKLADMGLIQSKDRSGHIASPNAPGAGSPSGRVHEDPPLALAHLLPEAGQRPSELRRIEHPHDWNRYPYPFLYNQIDPAMFPLQGWRECMRLALNVKRLPVWSADAEGADNAALVEQLCQRLLSRRGLRVRPDEILITAGAQNALFILGLLFRGTKGAIAVEDPGYPEARNAFALAGNPVAPVPVDRDGLMPDRLPDGIKAVYTTPSHQFPTAATMTLARRRALLAAAAERGLAVIEDDYEAEMNYRRDRLTPLRALDDSGAVIYTGSLSKTVSPGLRLGFMAAHPEIIREARAIRRIILRQPPAMLQEAMAQFLALGHYDAHLRRLHRRYKTRWEEMSAALAAHLPGLALGMPEGGTCFWIKGPQGMDTGALGQRLQARGVLFDNGPVFFADPADGQGHFRLGFAALPVKSIAPGIRIIAEEMAALS
jgi:GntR family transcriptional regulator/MocR family aminotransferase